MKMRVLKKSWAALVALFTTLAMALTLVSPAAVLADETFTITMPNGNGRTYEIYQIFTGDYSEDEEGHKDLANIKWGKNGRGTLGTEVGTEVLNALSKVVNEDDAAKIKVVENYVNLDSEPFRGNLYANGQTVEVPAGYYLIKDRDSESSDEYVVKIVGDVTIQPKSTDIPTLEKKVYEDDETVNHGYGKGYVEVADYEIGEEISFKLIGSIPNMSSFATYEYTFHDTQSDGLDTPTDFHVYLVNNLANDNGVEVDASYYSVNTAPGGGETFTVTFKDLKSVPNVEEYDYIMVTYKSKLNANAVIGSTEGNPNEVYLTFTTKDGNGTTEKEYVVIFTWTLNGDKVDGETNEKLSGAEFVLLDSSMQNVAVVQNGKFVMWSPVRMDYTAMQYADWQAIDGAILTSNNSGAFGVRGLDDDVYYLLEVKAPGNYNALTDPIKAEIVSELNTNVEYYGDSPRNMLTGLYLYVNNAEAPESCVMQGDGVATVTIENFSGTTLPETGGIGTTIFYIVGGVLVLVAVVVLVAKRRADHEE